jgi:hypothetical protein
MLETRSCVLHASLRTWCSCGEETRKWENDMRVRLWAACLLGGTRTSCAGNDTERFGVGKLNVSRTEKELGRVNGR